MKVLGVDVCRRGWVGVVLDPVERSRLRAIHAAHFDELVGLADATGASEVAVVAVDIPIGLSGTGYRAADLAARSVIGARWASVFLTPVRLAAEAATYAEANDANRAVTGAGISRQAWALIAKAAEVERWRLDSGRAAWEVHPEVVFATLAGRPMGTSKKTWAGLHERAGLLAQGGLEVPGELGLAGSLAAPDDVLDAAAVAWTAQRIAAGAARSLPDPPELDDLGRPMAIWV